MPDADPIFTLIKLERAAWGRHGEACLALIEAEQALSPLGTESLGADDPRLDRLREAEQMAGEAADAHELAQAALFAARPTTALGAVAIMEVFEERVDEVESQWTGYRTEVFRSVRAVLRKSASEERSKSAA